MRYFALCMLAPGFWASAAHNIPARVILAAGLISLIVQALKNYIPALSGKYVIATNTALSVLAVLATSNPDSFWTAMVWQQILTTILTASGIHATAKSFSQDKSPDPIPGDAPKQWRQGLVVLLVVAMCGVSGCAKATAKTPATATAPTGSVDSIDANANQTLQAIHAFLLQVTTDVQSKAIILTPNQLTLLDHANSTYNTAAGAEQAYHAAGGGSSSALAAALNLAQTAFTSAQSSIAASVTTK